jgi:alanine racemase
MSHCSDGDNAHITNDQIIRFKEWTHAVFGHQLPRYRHLGASDGLLTINDPYFNARRPGLICYGYAWDPTLPIKPIMEIWSTIVSTHEIQPGEWVSYTKSWRATHPSRIGTIPFGYDEWLIRSLSNKYFFSSKKKNLIPQVWNICMNNASIDITDTDLTIGDTICVIWPHQDLRDLATVAQTNVYELLTSIKPWLKKIIIW